jgi:hypothetical protein
MAKYKPGDFEFELPEKLLNLYLRKDYGQYGKWRFTPEPLTVQQAETQAAGRWTE